jgi:hypothetical protein
MLKHECLSAGHGFRECIGYIGPNAVGHALSMAFKVRKLNCCSPGVNEQFSEIGVLPNRSSNPVAQCFPKIALPIRKRSLVRWRRNTSELSRKQIVKAICLT